VCQHFGRRVEHGVLANLCRQVLQSIAIRGSGMRGGHDASRDLRTQQVIDPAMRGFDAPALAQNRNIVRVTPKTLAGKRKRQLARSCGDGLPGSYRPGLCGQNVPRDGLVPHLGVQVGAQQSLLRKGRAAKSSAGSCELMEYPSFFRHAPTTSAWSSSMVRRPRKRGFHKSAHETGAG